MFVTVDLQSCKESPKMAFKVLVFAAFVACATAAVVGPIPVQEPEPFNPHPQYTFDYAVQDPTTGDFKSQTETRDGPGVQGRYTVLEPNGSERIVEYTADDVHGFNAVVRHQPAGGAPAAPGVPVAKVAPVAKIVPEIKAVKAAPYGYAPFGYPAYHGYPGYAGYPGYSGYHGYSGYPHGYRSPFYGGYQPAYY
ncbi:hypothetical protein RI129_000542 [Pyrocoelia pectoralis]|uniref:Cuticle protein n=1 Tax=Pyrocoelia pectoralis TaxID=417401 RepID=A0AAN7VUH7_9COLE